MPSEKDSARLEHMLEAARDAMQFAEGRRRDDLDRDKQFAQSLRKSIEDLGEAAKHVSPEFRNEHPEIPWGRLAGTRDVLIHRYFGIDYDVVWRIATEHLPEVVAALEKIVPPEGEGDARCPRHS